MNSNFFFIYVSQIFIIQFNHLSHLKLALRPGVRISPIRTVFMDRARISYEYEFKTV